MAEAPFPVPARAAASGGSPRGVVIRGAAAMAVGMGIGRFVYTPILPLMEHEAGLTISMGSDLATVNYLGNLIGALAPIAVPALARSRLVLRASLLAVVVTLTLMPVTEHAGVWLALRFCTGVASGLLFVIASGTMVARLRGRAQHLVGWGFGGVGLGIALSGTLVLAVAQSSAGLPGPAWRASWWSAAILAGVAGIGGWTLRPEPPGEAAGSRRRGDLPRTRRWFAALLASYTLEGIGYIIAGTFLAAAISQDSPGWLGSGAWVVVGLAGIPGAAMWAYLARYRPRSTLLLCALIIQAAGIALPSLSGGIAPALISAAALGSTFIAISMMSVAIGAHLQFPRSVALLTAGFSTGQVLGPLVVRPLLSDGYHDALLAGSAIVAASAIAAVALRIGFPHRVGAMTEPSRAGHAPDDAATASR